jgi:hypothetical protein
MKKSHPTHPDGRAWQLPARMSAVACRHHGISLESRNGSAGAHVLCRGLATATMSGNARNSAAARSGGVCAIEKGPAEGGRISRSDAHGNRTTVTDSLPSSQTAPIPSPLISGVADIAFIKATMYALLAGAGCSHEVRNTPNGIGRVNRAQQAKYLPDHAKRADSRGYHRFEQSARLSVRQPRWS